MKDGLQPRIKAIVGLGNPGADYEGTRHNLGFEVVDFLKGNSCFAAGKGNYYRCETAISSLKVVLSKPTTFMNGSGIAVAELVEAEALKPSEILVVADDLNLPLERLRLRTGGSDGGHKGLASIIYHLNTQDFPRLRLGIGPVPEGSEVEEFVLERFRPEEVAAVRNMVRKAARAIEMWVGEGYEKAASQFNRVVDES